MSSTEALLESPRAAQRLYARVWRWHFFAAPIVIPFVLWRDIRVPKPVIAVAVVLCVIMPLLGLSIVAIEVLDRLFGRVLARPT